MNVIACGTEVITRIGHRAGMITAVAIRFDAVVYEVTFYDNNEFHTIWAREGEMEFDKKEETKIGFKK